MLTTSNGGALRSITSVLGGLFRTSTSLLRRPLLNRHARRRHHKLHGTHIVQALEPRVLLSATLQGSAWYDNVYDNLHGVGDAQASAIVVNLLDSSGTQLDSTATVNGDYSFTGLADGDYMIEFELPANYSFVLEGVGVDGTVDSDVDVLTGRSHVITLTDGDVVDIDGGFVLTSELPETYSGTLELSSIADGGLDGVIFNGIDGGDYAGAAISSAGDVNGDGYDDLLIGAYGAQPNGSYSGETYLVYGDASGWTTTIELSDVGSSVAGAVFNGVDNNDGAGVSVSSAGDMNGDGYDDLFIGAGGAANGGRSYLVYGSASGLTGTIELADVGSSVDGAVFIGTASSGNAGSSVSNAGDVNGDGYLDLLIGANFASPNGSQSGQAFLVYGTSSGFTGNVALTDVGSTVAGAVFNGIAQSDNAGWDISAAGDINGDGFDDLLIGSRYATGSADDSGQAYLVYGSSSGLTGTLELSDLGSSVAGAIFNGAQEDDRVGWDISGAGDVNGDGYDDLLISGFFVDSNGLNNNGSAYLIYGQASGLTGTIDLADVGGSVAGVTFNGIDEDDFAGRSVSSAGDVNGDGYDDLIIGAPYANPNGGRSGETYLVYGQSSGLTGTIALSEIGSTVAGVVFNGIAGGDYSGIKSASAGDVNGDGYDDLLIGAQNAKPNGNNSGQTYLVYGGLFKPTDVYVDDDWSAVSAGVDPDGSGGATNFGYDAFATIQEAINAVSTGGTVHILSGTYDGDITVSKSLTLYGESGIAADVVIDETTFNGTGITVMSTATDTTISNLTIQGTGHNYGISASGSAGNSFTIDNIVVSDADEKGIYVTSYGGLVSLNNVMADGNDVGVDFTNSSNAIITNSTLINNFVVGIQTSNSYVSILNNQITDNLYGAAFASSTVLLEGNDLSDNLYYGLLILNNSLVDAGDFNDANVTGLGTGSQANGSSDGHNILKGYSSGVHAIYNLNGSADHDVLAQMNNFGLYNAADIELVVYHDVDKVSLSHVYTDYFIVKDVYVDDDWASYSTGVDPDGAGPATIFGYDAFATITDAINAVANGGTVHVADGTYTENITVNDNLTIQGIFTLDGTLTIDSGATLSPGNSPGLIYTGNLVLGSGAILDEEIDGTTAGTEYDQLNVTGTVDITDSTLNVTLGYTPTHGDSYIIINNDDTDAIVGTFAGLAEGDLVQTGSTWMTISYVGGDGNDVVLTATVPGDVYVDDDWAGTAFGDDPDGAGPATAFGYDAFAIIEDGVNAVITDGTVHVYAGTYDGDITIERSMTVQGETGDAADIVIDASSNSYGITFNDGSLLTLSHLSVFDAQITGILGLSTDADYTFEDVVVRRSAQTGIFFQVEAGDINLTDVISSDNGYAGLGVLQSANSLTDTNGRYNFNDNSGMSLISIANDVTLTRTILNNNNDDNSGSGNGLSSAALGSTYGIGGNLTLNGVIAADTDGAGTAYHQQYGIYIEDGVAGNVIVQDHDNGSDVQQTAIVGNDQDGLYFNGVVGTIDITGGIYSLNSNRGIFINDADGLVTIDGVEVQGNNTGIRLSHLTGIVTHSDIQYSAAYGVDISTGGAISILDNDTIGIKNNDVGVHVSNGTALLENNILTDNIFAGLWTSAGALVDAGDYCDCNVTGLGTGSLTNGSSAGGNIFTGYAGATSNNYAIFNTNSTVANKPDVYAQMNEFGFIGHDYIGNVIHDIADDSGVTEVFYDYAIPPQTVTDVYVDDDWSGVALFADPDGAGPATAMGIDAFYTIQDGVDAVADTGTVHVYDGTYYENVRIIHDLTVTGVSMDPTGVIVDAQSNGQTIEIEGVDDVTIEYLTVQYGDDDNIDIEDSDTVTLNHLLVLYADEDGIDAEGVNELIVTNTTIQYMGDDGISLYDIGSATLEELTIEYGYGSGIAFEYGGLLDIDGLWISDFDFYGIWTEGVDEVDIYDATVQYTGDSSMELYYGYSVVLDTVNVSYTDGYGFDIYDWFSTDMTDVTVTHAALDGMWIDYVDDVNLTRVTSQYNAYDGIFITDTVDITLLDVNSSYNVGSGLNIELAESLSDTNGIYTENEDSGISILYVMGDSIFTRTTATNNNADLGGYGVGLEIYGYPFYDLAEGIIEFIDGIEGLLGGLPSDFLDLLPDQFLDIDFGSLPFSAGGSVTIQGGTFSDTDGNPFNGNTFSQTAGIIIQGIAGDVTIEAHDDGNDIQTPTITGNDEIGVGLFDIAGNIDISDADISDNYGEGVDIDNVYNVDIANTTIDGNNGYGAWITNVDDITLSDIIAQFNHLGILVTGADSLTDTDGLYANNSQAGLQLHNIDVLLSMAGTTVRDNGTYGLWLTDQEDANLTQMTITGNDVGVFMEDFIHAFDLTNSFVNDNRIGVQVGELLYNYGITVFDNDLSGNTEYAIQNLDTGTSDTTDPVDASGNWFGSTDPLAILTMVDGLIDYSYYLASETDTSLDSGFQGSFATLYVTYLDSQIQAISRIQEAIDHVDDDGTVIVQSGPYDGDVTVDADKTLKGAISFNGTLTLTDNAIFEPGNSPGVISIGDDFVGQAGTTLVVEINGDTIYTDYDILFVDGNVTLGDMTLVVTLGYVPDDGDTITLIDNVGPNAVDGTFDGLPEGATITISGYEAIITYVGGDGNDIQLVFQETNVAPTADAISEVAVEDGDPVVIAYNADDANSDDDVTTLTYNFITTPSEGSVSDNGDGTFTFNPGTDFQDLGVGETRQVSFTYQATDSHNATSSIATIIITVQGTNDFPNAAPNLASTQYQTPIDIDVISNDTDIDGDVLHVSGFETTPWNSSTVGTSNLGVTVTINPDGTVHYDPTGLFDSLAPGDTVRDYFRYFATDPYGLSDRHIVFIDVTRPTITTSLASFSTPGSTSSDPRVTSNMLGSGTVGTSNTINNAALAFASHKAQLHVMPSHNTSSHWLKNLLGSDNEDDTTVNLLNVDTES